MNSDFVTYEQAMILKELGFDRDCIGYFIKDKFIPCDTYDLAGTGGGFVPFDTKLNLKNDDIVARPLYQQAFKWINDELRKYKKQFNVNSSKFYVNFENLSDSLDGLIDILIKIKTSQRLDEDDNTLIAKTEHLDGKSTIEDFASKAPIINELQERLKRYSDENISLKAKIRSYAKDNNDLKNQKEKKQIESEYLNEEVVNLISKNKKNVLEIERLKNSVVSLSRIKDKLEDDLRIRNNTINNLEEIIDTLNLKIELLNSKIESLNSGIENRENIILENYIKFADDLVEEAKETKKVLNYFTVNNKEMERFIRLANKYYQIAIEYGCEDSQIKLDELKKDKRFSKYL
jgi:chromosome segregation ATPase